MAANSARNQSYKNYKSGIDEAYGVLGSHDYFQELKAAALLRIIKRLAPKGETLRILDLGAGIGTMLSALPGRHLLVGAEPESNLISQAPPGPKQFCMVSASGVALPFQDACFDVVYMASVLHHVEQQDLLPLLKECARIIRSGGSLVIFEHNAYNLAVVLFLKAFVTIDRDAHFLTPNAVMRLIQQAKLLPSRPVYMCFFPGFLKCLLWLERYLSWLPLSGQYCLVSLKTAGTQSESTY